MLPREERVVLKSRERLARCLGPGRVETGEGVSSEIGLGPAFLGGWRFAASGAFCCSKGGGGGGGGGGVAAVLVLPGLATLLEPLRLRNEKYEAARCSSGLLGLAAPEDIEPDLGVRGVARPGDPRDGMWSPISRRRAFHPGVAVSVVVWCVVCVGLWTRGGESDRLVVGGPGNGSSRDEPIDAWRFPPERDESREMSWGRGLVLLDGGVGGITLDENWAGFGNLTDDWEGPDDMDVPVS